VRGEVELADALKSKVRAGMTLYIVAKSVASPGPPVAAMRTTTGSWPVKFELSDAMAMLEGRNLSSAGMVTIEARISLSGLANSAPGDFLGSTPPMPAAGAKPLRIVINKTVN
jgi:cytochrome c-type biogenesis protein CcmH